MDITLFSYFSIVKNIILAHKQYLREVLNALKHLQSNMIQLKLPRSLRDDCKRLSLIKELKQRTQDLQDSICLLRI